MANIVWLSTAGEDFGCVEMSNGLTDVFIDVLVISGSKSAQTIDEKRLIVWLAEKEQSKVGIGTVGFDICDMPWNKDAFAENKEFLLKIIEAAKSKEGRELLGYKPNEELLLPCLNKFSRLISKTESRDVNPEALKEWLAAAEPSDPVITGFPKCPKHGVLLSCFGCRICSNSV